MREIFKDIKNFEKMYQISNRGRVKSLPKRLFNGRSYYISKEKILKPINLKIGYSQICLHKNGEIYPKYIHRLVLETFSGECPPKHECRHLDGNPLNNKIDNLKWGTPKENQKDRIKHKTSNTGENHPRRKLKEKEVFFIRYLLEKNIKQSLIIKMFKISHIQLYRIKKRISWSHLW